MSKAPRPSVLGNLTAAVAPADGAEVKEAQTPAKNEADMFRTSVYIPRAVADKLHEIAFHEGRKKFNDLLIEGIDAVLTKRGYSTTAEIRESSKA
ncbi:MULTISPECIES: hypothetical protein [Rhizobiaceae]|jgi:hypothetical protein|uniref:hypothetical protein n=1 Tax=Rhizobiaceae TaxID=82115 RepID=UPI000437C445|nr:MULTISPECIES: hypothetical protein [Rhizobiaceae]EYR79535.1 hypothetical protein SHLA_81c000260 [Shinella sp. DD12]QSZ60823.1 hypothetical protein BTN45_26820 [Rhizobium sp. ZX09]